ncbi:unnamed protein product [Amoebophrya sp. A120]|nr:unnamed protein product [Amoebophrya sp. A120]|eukprot:GSA120T00012792001.1
MAVYFDYVVTQGGGGGSPASSPSRGSRAEAPSWSKDLGAEPLLAVGLRNKLQLFSQEGEFVQDAVPTRKSGVSCSDWHPTRREVIAGWQDGAVTYSRPSSSSSSSSVTTVGQDAHQGAPILAAKFSPDGGLCVVSDAKGVVSVYNTEAGRAQYLLYYRKPGAIDQICFRQRRSPSFFFAGEQGVVYGADEHGACSEKYKVGSPIILLEYCASANRVVLITQGTMLATFQLDAEGKVRGETKLKLSCGPKPDSLRGVCIASDAHFLIATVSEESIVRIWNVLEEESYLLSLSEVDENLRTDKAVAVDYNQRKRTLAVGTKQGRVLQWRCVTNNFHEHDWQHLAIRSFEGEKNRSCDAVHWGTRIGESILSCSFSDGGCVLLAETQLSHSLRAPFLGVQVAPAQLMLHHVELEHTSKHARQIPDQMLDCPFRIRGVSVGPPYVAIWSAKQVRIYQNNDQRGLGEHASFDRPQAPIASCSLYVTKEEASLLVACGSKIEVCNLQGNVKKSLQFSSETEGSPHLVDVGGSTLVASTTKQLLKLWNLARATPKALSSGRRFEDANGNLLGEIRQLRANCSGSRIALLVDPLKKPGLVAAPPSNSRSPGAKGSRSPTASSSQQDNVAELSKVYVYDVEFDSFACLDLGSHRLPVSFSWDPVDPRLLAVEAVPSSSGASAAASALDLSQHHEEEEHGKVMGEVVLVFASENTLLVQDGLPNPRDAETNLPLIPVSIVTPYLYFLKPVDGSSTTRLTKSASVLSKQVLRDFEGLEEVNSSVKKALLDFSYHIASGNPDEAYKAVSKNITSKAVWESLAKMCVKTRRLDVVQKCVGQLGKVRAATAIRPPHDSKIRSLTARHEADPNVKLAAVAAHLGMAADAEELYMKANRYDLLNKLYQALNEWDKALELAETKDRIHLKTTYYNYAVYLQAFDKFEARKYFQKAGTELPDCTRLLLTEPNADQLLVDYVNKNSSNEKLQRWYAQYLESKQDLAGAVKCYTTSQDWHSLVRLHCFENQIEKATQICEETRDKAACYHLAGVLEQRANAGGGDVVMMAGGGSSENDSARLIKEAVRFYSMAGCVKHSIRLADHLRAGGEGDLMTLALASGKPEDLSYAAKYYEKQGNSQSASKAVLLYQKAGQTGRAMELCFSAKLFEPLRKIVEDIVQKAEQAAAAGSAKEEGTDTPAADPELLARCAEFFTHHEQHDKAVQLLCMSHQVSEAIDLCYQHNVFISEEMAEKLTPEKQGDDKEEWRKTQLRKIAKLCKDQGSFQVACKKYTQAGEKVKAMKALLKSGDTERITFFAGTARTPEIYILAANYMQSLDWHSRPEMTKQILSFYSKAKDYQKMSGFYATIAMVEIDEYRDYEKAASCLKDSLKVLQKANLELSEQYTVLEKKLKFVEQFAALKTLKADQVVQACETFLQVPEVENYLRVGDVYAALIEAYVAQGLYQDAFGKVEEMRRAKIALGPYVDAEVLQKIQAEMGTLVEEPVYENYASTWKPDGDEVDEEIDEDIDDE